MRALLLRWARRLFGVVVFGLLAKGIVGILGEFGLHPEDLLRDAGMTALNASWLSWLLAGLLGIATLIAWEWFNLGNKFALLLPQSADATSRRIGLKDLLGAAIQEGERIHPGPAPEATIVAWAQRTRDMIASAVGQGEAALFLSDNGLVFHGDGSQASRHRNYIVGRLQRISDLLRRAETVPINQQFDPDQWRTP